VSVQGVEIAKIIFICLSYAAYVGMIAEFEVQRIGLIRHTGIFAPKLGDKNKMTLVDN
jgi:hypothetical protein